MLMLQKDNKIVRHQKIKTSSFAFYGQIKVLWIRNYMSKG